MNGFYNSGYTLLEIARTFLQITLYTCWYLLKQYTSLCNLKSVNVKRENSVIKIAKVVPHFFRIHFLQITPYT